MAEHGERNLVSWTWRAEDGERNIAEHSWTKRTEVQLLNEARRGNLFNVCPSHVFNFEFDRFWSVAGKFQVERRLRWEECAELFGCWLPSWLNVQLVECWTDWMVELDAWAEYSTAKKNGYFGSLRKFKASDRFLSQKRRTCWTCSDPIAVQSTIGRPWIKRHPIGSQ